MSGLPFARPKAGDRLATMVPQVFLSLSGSDDAFVEAVHAELPDGLAVFYRKSFENGRSLLDEMEKHVDRASVFVLFASNASLESKWVGFEVDRARLQVIQRPGLRLLIFPVGKSVDLGKVPAWMREHWISDPGANPKDVARQIRSALLDPSIGGSAFATPVVGRGRDLDLANQRFAAHLTEQQQAPNVFVFAGFQGIGRRTFARYFMSQSLAASPRLQTGPVLLLPQYADIADLYRALREQIEPQFSLEKFKTALGAFNQFTIQEQITEIVRSMSHYSNLQQAVTLVTGNGLFEDRGTLKSWVPVLFDALRGTPIRLMLITSWQIREESLLRFTNVIQLAVGSLEDENIKAIVADTSLRFCGRAINLSRETIRAIGGHAAIAKAAARIASQQGAQAIDRNPHLIFTMQDAILTQNIDEANLTKVERDILCVLSWVPSLRGDLLEEVVKFQHGISAEEFAKSVSSLALGCLISSSDDHFYISQAIRSLFRRKHGYGGDDLLKSFSEVLQREWRQSVAADTFRTDLFDAFVFMHALEGQTLPHELRALLLPSTLEAIVKETYNRGRDDEGDLRKVIEWGGIARDMRMDEVAREEILSTVAKAHIQLTEYELADKIIDDMNKRSYRSTYFLNGFKLRKRDMHKDAIPYLENALGIRKYNRSVVHELAMCYRKLGMNEKLRDLLAKQGRWIDDSAMFLDMKIGLALGAGDLRSAEDGISRLRHLPGDDGRSARRQAQILMRKHEYDQALDLLNATLAQDLRYVFPVRTLRAIAAANAGDVDQARADIQWIGSLPGRRSAAHRLEAHLYLAQGDYKAAEAVLAKVPVRTPEDRLLEARILEAKAADLLTPLDHREPLKQRATLLRQQNRFAWELDFE